MKYFLFREASILSWRDKVKCGLHSEISIWYPVDRIIRKNFLTLQKLEGKPFVFEGSFLVDF